FPILMEGLHEQIMFLLNVMHCYKHQWACQIVYSPHRCCGVGLTDREGVE
ncbi:hypothetical protein B0H14DRAFT_2372317, partial [Mycena olivaceomarginata]